MTRRKCWLPGVSLCGFLAASCAMPAGGAPKVDCEALCNAKNDCDEIDLDACLENCREEFAHCLSSQGEFCLECRSSCEPGCDQRGAACHCLPPGTPGAPCTSDVDCTTPGTICYDGSYCVGSGPLRVTLSFEVDSDFDLHLRTPAENEISFSSRTVDGGNLDVDQCVQSCGYRSHVENIVFADVAPAGRYEVWVVNYNGRSGGAFRIDVVTHGELVRFQGTLPHRAHAESERFHFTLPEPTGQR